MTKYIPSEGEAFVGYVPAIRKLAKITVGVATTNDVVVGETAGSPFTLLDISDPIIVFGLWTQVTTAFTASFTATIGDSTTADRFLADTTIAPESSGAVWVASTGLTVPYEYAAAQDITITCAATAAAGAMNVFVDYAVLAD